MKSRIGLVAGSLALAVVLVAGIAALARQEPAAVAASAEVSLAELPAQARETVALIRRGGPYPYRRDGSVFGNREKRLPLKPRGYYTEYTVKTPSERDRGPRRIVAGKGATGDPATSGEYYYTDDHYNSFRRIRE
jgi:ribonuclease T1